MFQGHTSEEESNQYYFIGVSPLIFSGNSTLHFVTSCALNGEKSIKMNDKSRPSDGPEQREHSVRMAFHNNKEKQFVHLGECFILGGV